VLVPANTAPSRLALHPAACRRARELTENTP
jgi:hypothetical protein